MNRVVALISILAGAMALTAAPAAAKVASASPGGFKVIEVAEIAAKPDAVWARLVHPEKWWIAQHTWSGDAKDLKLELKAGGCWCESWAKGSSQHMRVVYIEPGKELRLAGALGPLQWQGVSGAMIWQVAAAGDGTKVSWMYTVGGYADPSLDTLAAPVDEVLGQQIGALKASLEAPGAH